MQPAYELPQVSTTRSRAPEIDADVVAVPIAQDQIKDANWLDQASGGELTAAQSWGAFTGHPCQLLQTSISDTRWRSRRVLGIGAGPSGELGSERARRIG